MPRAKQKLCMGCLRPFHGRADAKTCSVRCRKRFQRARELAAAGYDTRYLPPGFTYPVKLKPSMAEGVRR